MPCEIQNCRNQTAICAFCSGGDAFCCVNHSTSFVIIQNKTICDVCILKYTCVVCNTNGVKNLTDKCNGCYNNYDDKCQNHTAKFKVLVNDPQQRRYCQECLSKYVCDVCQTVGIVVRHCHKCKKNFCEITQGNSPECMRKLNYNQVFEVTMNFLTDNNEIQN